jgi:pimeloyl-ACP methyl ester carboxylesterase
MSVTSELKTAVEKKILADTRFSAGQVISADGTIIGYRQIGSGPGLVILHGGSRAGHHYARLAQALADSFTVYLPDRRGRGLSGPAGDNYSLQKELDDVSAVLEATGARLLFGHSAGGFFALETALRLPLDKLVLYEPAVSINGSLPLGWLPAFEQALTQKDFVDATIIFLRGLQMGPKWLNKVPARFLAPFVGLLLRSDEVREMIELFPTLVREVKEFQRPGLDYERYRNISAKTLLFGGARSPEYLRYALRTLAKTLPHTWLIELPNLDHNAPDENAPEVVARELKQFLT